MWQSAEDAEKGNVIVEDEKESAEASLAYQLISFTARCSNR